MQISNDSKIRQNHHSESAQEWFLAEAALMMLPSTTQANQRSNHHGKSWSQMAILTSAATELDDCLGKTPVV